MNTDLNERLKQCQKNYYASKKYKKVKMFLQFKDELKDIKI